jgi:hypothetical protein
LRCVILANAPSNTITSAVAARFHQTNGRRCDRCCEALATVRLVSAANSSTLRSVCASNSSRSSWRAEPSAQNRGQVFEDGTFRVLT